MIMSKCQNIPSVSRIARNMLALFLFLVPFQVLAQGIKLVDSSFVALPNKKLEVRLDFDAPPPVPKAYSIESPPRVVMDFWGVENDLGQKVIDVKAGQVDSFNMAQTEGRLRVVANLYGAVPYKSYTEDNSLFLVFEGREESSAADSKALRMKSASQTKVTTARESLDDRTRIQGIDFERMDQGHGRVIITMSDDKAGLDIIEEGNNVVVNLMGAKLSAALEKRVDVQDFATPVLFIDSMPAGENTAILVKPTAEPYEYMAYQTGNQLVLDFKPVTESEAEQSRNLFPFTGEKIDLNFQNVEIRAILQILAEVAEMNLVVSDTVSGNITLRLKNVPWDQALDIILKTRGLDKREVGNVLLIAPANEIAERERVELESRKQVEELSPLRTEFIQVDFRSASEMKSRVEEAKLVSERGFIMSDDETNILMVRDTASQLQEIRATISKFDVEVAQVLVEARLVAASTTYEKDLGVKWGFGYLDDDGTQWQIGGAGGVTPGGTTIPNALNVDLGVTPQSSIAIGVATSSVLLSAELTALQSEGKAEIISQPKVVTTNGKSAKIESGQEIPFQTVEDGEVSIEFKDVVLSLEVTPQINPGDRITLELVIKQDSIGQVLPNGELSINNNELQTSVNVGDGDTIVLGGVFRDESTEAVSKTPLLGDLPVIGALFRKTEVQNDKSELLIFITPKLIRESLQVQ